MTFSKDNGINVHNFNKQSRISGRDYLRRVRRAKYRLLKSRISLATPRPSKQLKGIFRSQKGKGITNIGIHVAPKLFKFSTINKEGQLTEMNKHIYGRKIPLQDIIQAENKRLDNAGVLYITSDEEYNSMTLLNLQNKLTTFNSSNILLTSSARDILAELNCQSNIPDKEPIAPISLNIRTPVIYPQFLSLSLTTILQNKTSSVKTNLHLFQPAPTISPYNQIPDNQNICR
ncbi:unnamed protein product [Mytilus edulis]|uniref:Uncharacterized protein n=1 Tax=Mytilus edulis TaxID=6550 RepID=A0A8S3QJ20_MYTED|nr:unnamed protein product [Mytilus edulis]